MCEYVHSIGCTVAAVLWPDRAQNTPPTAPGLTRATYESTIELKRSSCPSASAVLALQIGSTLKHLDRFDHHAVLDAGLLPANAALLNQVRADGR